MAGCSGRPARSDLRPHSAARRSAGWGQPGRPTRWGWHQLDSRWAARLVEAAGVGPGDLVFDVGAGTGVITEALCAVGARVVAIELHPGRAADLRARFRDQPVRVVRADAADLRLPGKPFTVVANPPFSLTAALLRRLTARHSRMERAALVLPAWAVARWANGRGNGGTGVGGRFELSAGVWVPRTAFRPPPPAPARLLEIRRR